ncbi:hypothetical protein ECPA23_3337, partial [Escherichia coli PA23]
MVRFDFVYCFLPDAVNQFDAIRNEISAFVLVAHHALLVNIAF